MPNRLSETAHPAGTCVHHLFEKQAGNAPKAVAVEFEGQSLTYAELDARASRLAAQLSALGVGPEVLVPIFMRRSLEMVVGVLGILKAGGAYVPLDPRYPRERLQFMLADTAGSVLVTQTDLASDLPQHSATLVYLDSTPGEHETPSSHMPKPVGPDNLAYVIYTSGSTGRPKGVQICHRSAVNLLLSVVAQLELTAQDTMLAVTTLSFDVSVAEIFLPLLTGGRLVVVSSEAAADGSRLLRILQESRATIMHPTPVTWRLLLAAGWSGNPELRIIATGEALLRPLANQLLHKGAGLWNFYGPTETTIWSTSYRVVSEEGPVFIGKPLANTTAYILDLNLKPLPVGATGELYLGGDGLARGYLNQPELTAKSFIRDPFSREPGRRLYKTGDLARYAADGNIECLGRIDHQVKIRGYRIELGEVETVLAEHPAVREVVVVARENESGEKDLVCYIVLTEGSDIRASALRDHLKTKLPEYMVPSVFVPLDRLPRTPTGKLDREALPKPEMMGHLDSSTHVAPRTDVERRLVEIWQQVLGLSRLGVNDNFLELGGNSLRAIELTQGVEQALGVRLPVESVYRAPTVAQFQTLIAQRSSGQPPSGVVCLQGEGPGLALFCLHGMPQHLARLLKPDFRVYGLDRPIRQQLTVQELATPYLRLLKSVQPEGPYHLIGFSFGGLLAVEVARQLHAEHQKIHFLCLLDSFYFAGLRAVRLPQLRKWAYHSRMLIGNGPGHLVGRLDERRKRLLREQTDMERVEANLSNEIRSQARRIWEAQQRFMDAAARSYRVEPYPGDVLLFRVTGGSPLLSHLPDSTNGWKAAVQGRIDVVEVNCTHMELFEEPRVQVVAEQLRRVLTPSVLAATA